MSGAPSRTNDPTPQSILRDAADLLEVPGQWTQGAFARTKAGRPVGWTTEAATCWCAAGAIFHVGGDNSSAADRAWHAANAVVPRGCPHLAVFNDERTQGDVVALLRKAAAKLDQDSPRPARPK